MVCCNSNSWAVMVMSTSAWCERATAMLAAGLPSQRVLDVLGPPPASVADGGALRVAWAVCVQHGAALANVLIACAEASRDWERIARERASALAGPRATARLVSLLPIVALLLGALFGLNTLAVLLGSVLGWLCLLVGAALTLASLHWTARLVRRATVAEPAPGFNCELTAQLIASGVPAERAATEVDRAWPGGSSARDAALQFSALTGMPPVRALRAEAAAERADAAGRSELLAAELGVKLTLPLGVCVLPAFVCWGVLPMIISVIGATAGSLS